MRDESLGLRPIDEEDFLDDFGFDLDYSEWESERREYSEDDRDDAFDEEERAALTIPMRGVRQEASPAASVPTPEIQPAPPAPAEVAPVPRATPAISEPPSTKAARRPMDAPAAETAKAREVSGKMVKKAAPAKAAAAARPAAKRTAGAVGKTVGKPAAKTTAAKKASTRKPAAKKAAAPAGKAKKSKTRG